MEFLQKKPTRRGETLQREEREEGEAWAPLAWVSHQTWQPGGCGVGSGRKPTESPVLWNRMCLSHIPNLILHKYEQPWLYFYLLFSPLLMIKPHFPDQSFSSSPIFRKNKLEEGSTYGLELHHFPTHSEGRWMENPRTPQSCWSSSDSKPGPASVGGPGLQLALSWSKGSADPGLPPARTFHPHALL